MFWYIGAVMHCDGFMMENRKPLKKLLINYRLGGKKVI